MNELFSLSLILERTLKNIKAVSIQVPFHFKVQKRKINWNIFIPISRQYRQFYFAAFGLPIVSLHLVEKMYALQANGKIGFFTRGVTISPYNTTTCGRYSHENMEKGTFVICRYVARPRQHA